MRLTKTKKIICYFVAFIGIIGMLVLELGDVMISDKYIYGEWICKTFSRISGGIVCIVLMTVLVGTHTTFKHRSGALKRLAIVLPCFAVAVNNIPFLSVEGITFFASMREIFLYALFCFSVGFFEEMAFRGCVFTVMLGRMSQTRWGVLIASLISSALFGLIHIINLFAGASVGGVILQVGYSFLIGALCSIVLVKTSNVWYCVILHSLYNFAGGLASEFGTGKIWTTPTVILTAVVAVAVTVYTFILWYNVKKGEIEYVANGKAEND